MRQRINCWLTKWRQWRLIWFSRTGKLSLIILGSISFFPFGRKEKTFSEFRIYNLFILMINSSASECVVCVCVCVFVINSTMVINVRGDLTEKKEKKKERYIVPTRKSKQEKSSILNLGWLSFVDCWENRKINLYQFQLFETINFVWSVKLSD